MAAELNLSSRMSTPPASVRNIPTLIRCELCHDEPPIVAVTFAGRITLPDIQRSRQFGNVVRSLAGKPFRVLCDFTQTLAMPEEVSAVFIRGQEFAMAHGMERDAFVCASSVLRLQFARIARESGRIERLGPLPFFETVAEARRYLEGNAAPPSNNPESRGAISRRVSVPSRPRSRV